LNDRFIAGQKLPKLVLILLWMRYASANSVQRIAGYNFFKKQYKTHELGSAGNPDLNQCNYYLSGR